MALDDVGDPAETPTEREFDYDRTVALSDGVFAIALTLLILNVDEPSNHGDFWARVGDVAKTGTPQVFVPSNECLNTGGHKSWIYGIWPDGNNHSGGPYMPGWPVGTMSSLPVALFGRGVGPAGFFASASSLSRSSSAKSWSRGCRSTT